MTPFSRLRTAASVPAGSPASPPGSAGRPPAMTPGAVPHTVSDVLSHEGSQRAVAAPVWRPLYQYSEWITAGNSSAAAQLTINNPFDSPAEMQVVAYVSLDSTVDFLVVDSALQLTAAATLDAASSGRGVMPLVGGKSSILNESWVAINAGASVTYFCNGTSGSWVCVQFRRRINAGGVYSNSET